MAEEDTAPPVAVSSLVEAPQATNVNVSTAVDLTYTVKPDSATDKSLRIATSDPTIATVT